MKKQLHILQGLIILIIILISGLLAIKFIYNINHEKMDTTYMWNINYDNLKVTEGSKKGNISLENNTLNMSVILEKEKEFYEFTLDVKNEGTLDAELKNINLKIENPKKVLTHKITYQDNTEIKIGDILKSNDNTTIKVRIDYPKQKETIYEKLELKLSLEIEYTAIY